MNTLLRIDSSLRTNGSYSRSLGDYFVRQWKAKHQEGRIVERDVAQPLMPHLTEQTINGFFNSSITCENLELSNSLIEELYQCDEILITCPMYNYGIPSSLKAYFDLIVRSQKTFVYENGPRGLLLKKSAYIISALGDPQPAFKLRNPLEDHLTRILNHIGINEIQYFALDGTVILHEIEGKIALQQSKIDRYLTID